MNKLGIFMNFWERDWNADHKKYIKKAAGIGFDVLEFQAQPLLEMSDDHIRELRKTADDAGIELTYIGVLLDTYHMNIEENHLGDAIRLVGAERLKGFHTGDNNRQAPGRGHIDWDEVFGALAEIGYKERIVSEPFVMQGGEVGRDVHVYRDLIKNPSEEAIDAEAKYLLDFEKSMLKKYHME